MPKNLRIGGLWASTIAGWGDLAWKTKWGDGGGGLSEVSWTMEPNTGAGTETWRHPALRPGRLVEVMDGPWCLGKAVIDEAEDDDGTYTALGLYREAERYMAFDTEKNATARGDVAIDRAIDRGLRWAGRVGVPNTPVIDASTTPSGVNRLHTLLDELADSTSKRWWLDADDVVHLGPDPTTPTYYLLPGLTDLGRSDDGYTSHLYGRRRGSVTTVTEGVADTVAAEEFGRYEDAIDLTPLGVITQARALETLNGLMAKGRARPSFTQSIEVTADQLTTVGGVRADLSSVTAGQVVRSLGMVDDARLLDGRTYLDWIIGETDYPDESDSINLSPLGLAPTDFQSVLASMFPRAQFTA